MGRRPRSRSTLLSLSTLAISTFQTLSWSGIAAAEPALITTAPLTAQNDSNKDEIIFFVGGITDAARSLKAARLEMVIDGRRTDAPLKMQSLADWATASAEGNPSSGSPVSVGLIYLWIEGVPTSVLDGIQGFFRRVPSRTPVYPTVYGRLRQGRARLAAADVSRLGDVPYLDGYRPNFIEAVRLDLPDLAADPAPLKLLLLVTDGRDFADPKGESPGDFAALGREIRKARVTPIVVALPAPEADAVQATANLRELHDAAGGFLRSVDQVQDIENTLESLGQAVADLQRVRLPVPWTWRLFGGAHRLSVLFTATDGQRLTADLGTTSRGAGSGLMMLAAGGALLVAGGVAATLLLRRRRATPRGGTRRAKVGHGEGEGDGDGDNEEESNEREDDDQDDDHSDAEDGDGHDDAVSALHDLIRRGASPRRAVEELGRAHPGSMRALVNLDPKTVSDPRYPYFRTRPGRLRMQEIVDLLAKKAEVQPALGDALARSLADAVHEARPAEKVAEAMVGQVPADQLAAFAGLDLQQLAEALRAVTRVHPDLGTPAHGGCGGDSGCSSFCRGRARHFRGVAGARGGPGRRGETLRLKDRRTVIGRGSECAICMLDDLSLAANHAEITIDSGEFVIAPLEGTVAVEGTQILERRRVLTDGETIALGSGLFIFKSARAGNLVSAITGNSR